MILSLRVLASASGHNADKRYRTIYIARCVSSAIGSHRLARLHIKYVLLAKSFNYQSGYLDNQQDLKLSGGLLPINLYRNTAHQRKLGTLIDEFCQFQPLAAGRWRGLVRGR